jgi:uncharacterized protein (TIGR02466 family)
MADPRDIAASQVNLLRHGMVANHEQLNAGLRPMLLEMSERLPDKGTNKVAGRSYFSNKWLSARELHRIQSPEMRMLAATIEQVANTGTWPGASARLRIIAMWAIVSRNGLEGEPHMHSGLVSGAYYVDAGDCDQAGNGAFAVYTPQGERMVARLQPKSGMMLMFPNTMWHGVQRYESDRPRIVLSFNLA